MDDPSEKWLEKWISRLPERDDEWTDEVLELYDVVKE